MPCPFSGLCVICFYRVCHTGFCTYKSVLSTVTVPDHSDMFLLLSLTLFIILLRLCRRRDEMDRLPRWLTRWMLASVKQRCFSVSSEIEKKWRERMLIPEVCVCWCRSCRSQAVASVRRSKEKTFLWNKFSPKEGKGEPHSVCIR